MRSSLEEALRLAKGPYSRLVLQYSYVMRDLIVQAKDPDFTAADWAPLAAFVSDDFERIGNFREKVNWSQYDDLLTMWGKHTEWDFIVRRVTEGDGYAILELEEFAKYADRTETYTSVSVYDFNAANKLQHLEIYLSKAEALSGAQAQTWNWEEVQAEIT